MRHLVLMVKSEIMWFLVLVFDFHLGMSLFPAKDLIDCRDCLLDYYNLLYLYYVPNWGFKKIKIKISMGSWALQKILSSASYS